jgi:hypothetical protein
MSVEVCSYRLALRHKPVGSQVLRTERGAEEVRLETKLSLQGSLGQRTVLQRSQLEANGGSSLGFQEEVAGGGQTRRFELRFDREQGLVRAISGPRDQAEAPYIRPYQDSLGLLYQLRQLPTEQVSPPAPLRVPMLGKDVFVERLGELTLDTVFGERLAHAFLLRPGNNYVYVDAEAPHYILKLTQRLEGQLLEALLVKVTQEQAMPAESLGAPRKGRGRSRGRRRRGRKRSRKT